MLKAIIAALVLCALPAVAAAQAAANITVGDRIRVSMADRPLQIGRVTAVDAGTIQLQPDGATASVSMRLVPANSGNKCGRDEDGVTALIAGEYRNVFRR